MAEKLKYLRDGQDEIRIDVNQDRQDGITPVRVEGPGSDIIRRAPEGSVMDRIRQGILQRRAAQSQPASTPTVPSEPVIPPDQSRSFAPFEDSAPITDLKFDKALANTLGYEGVGVDRNEVGDSGISQLGVTQKAWDAYADKIRVPRKPVTKLSDKERRQFYKDEYAKPLNLDNLPDDVAMVAFDYGVNAGPGKAAMDLQRILGVKPDGVIGPKTLAAIKSQNPKALAEKLLAMQESHYAYLVKKHPEEYNGEKAENGWRNRINAQRQKLRLGNFAQKMAAALEVEKKLPQYQYPDDPDLKIKHNLWLWQTVTGIDQLMEQVARIPAYAYDFFAIPQNFYAEVFNVPGLQTQSPDWLVNNPVAEYYRRSAELANKIDDRFGYVTERDKNGMLITRAKNFDDLVKEGDASEAAEYIGWQILTQAPQQLMVLAFYEARLADLGLNMLGLMSAAGSNFENNWEPSQTPGAKPVRKKRPLREFDKVLSTLNATFDGATDIYTEKMWGTGKAFTTMKEALIKRFGVKTTKGIIKDATKIILKGASSEYVEEYIASLSQDFADWAMGEDKEALKGMWGRALEAGLIGAGSSISMTAPSATLSAGVQAIGQRQEVKYRQAVERLKKMYGGSGEGSDVNVPGPGRMVTPRRLKEMAQKRLNDLETAAKGSPAVLGRTIPDPDRPGQTIEIADVPAKEGRILTQAEREERVFLKQSLSEDNIQSIADEYGYGLKTPTQSGVDTQAPSEQVIEGELYQAQKQAEENPVPQGNGLFKIDDPVMSEETLESTKNLAKTLKTGDIYESATGEEKFVIKVDKHGAIYFANEEGTWVRSILDASIGSDADGVRHTTFRWSNNGLSDLARGRIIRPSGESARYKVAEEDDTAETLIFVSPSIETSDAADMVNRENVTTLYKKTKGGKHASFKSAIRGVMIDLGVPADVSSALGIWEDGGEDTVIARLPEGTDIDTIKYLGAQAAKLYPQKAYLWFKPKKSGKNHMTKMTLPLKYDEAVGILLRNGIKFATVVPTKDGTEVYQFHDDKSQLKHSASVAKSMGGAIEMTSGDGGFVGGETRASAVAQYNKDIKESRARIIAKSLKEAKDVLRRKKKSLAESNARRAGKGVEGDSRADSRGKRPQGVLVGAEESLDQSGKLKVFQVAKAIAKALDVRYIGRDATPEQKKQRYKEGLRRFYDLARQSGRDVKEREFYAVAANKAIAQLVDTTFPELADPDKQGIFKVLLAITSNGNLVSLNTKYAMDQMRHYLDTGDFNTKTVYARNEISAHLKKLQELIDQYGEVEAVKHLTEYQKQLTPTGKQSAEPDAPRAVDYFGDKIGRYFTNVFGLGREVTIDLWQTRLYHILMGDIKSFYEVSVKRNKKGDFETGTVFPKVVESPGKVEKRVMREAITELANELGETPADLQSISWHEIKQLYAKFSGTEVEIMDYNDAVTDLLEDSGETDVQEGDRKFSRPGTDELGNELGYDEEMLRNKKGREFIAKWLPEYAHLLQQPASLTTDSGMRILGDYLRGVIRVLSGQPLSVYKHEGFHAFFDLFVSPQDKIRLLDAIQREYPDRVKAYADKYGVSQDRAAEEVMAEIMETIDNKRFVYEGKSIPEQIVTFLQQVIEKMKVFFGIDKAIIQDMADAFYEMRRSPSQARQVEERNLYAGQRAEGFEDVPEGDRFWAPDKKLRFEIPDKDAELTFKAEVETLASEAERIKKDETIHWASRNQVFEPVKKKLEDAIKSKRTLAAMLNHPELYKRYPWAKNIPIIVKKLPRGTMGQAYNSQSILSPEGSHIRISSSFLDNMTMLYSNTQMESYENFRNTLLHEVQHMIQAYENFAQGGSVSKYGFLNYVRLLGEVESRDVEARSRMTEEQRRALKAYESQVDPVEAATRDNWKRKIRSLDDVVVRQTGAVDFDIPRVYEAGSLRAQQIRTYFAKPAPDRMPAKPTSVYVIRIADESNADKDFSTFPSVAAVYEPFESRSAALAVLKNLETTIPEKKKQYLRDYGYGEAKPENVKAYVVQETHRTEGDRSEYNRVVDRKIVATEEDAQNFDETKILEELQRRMVGEKKKAIKSESSEPMYKIDERDSDILKDIDQKLKFGGYTQDQIKAEYAERGIDIQFKGEAIRVSPSKVKGMVREVTGQVKDEELADLKVKFTEQAKGARFGYRQGVIDAREKLTAVMREKLEKQGDEAEAVQSIKDAIVSYALEQLPKAERGTLLTVVRDAKTLNDAMEAGKKIDQILEQSQKKGAIGRIRALVGQAMDSGRMAVEYKDIVKKLVSGVELKGHREETLKDLQKTKDFIEAELKAGRDVEIPNRIYRALQILERKPASELELSELEAIITKIELVIKLGKLRLASREAQYEADKVAKIKELASGRVRPIRSKEGARDARLALLDKLIQQAKDRNDQAKLKKYQAEQTKLMKQKAFRVEAKGWLEGVLDYFDKNVANSQILDKARQPMDHFFQTIGDQYHRVFKAPLDLLYGNYTQELQALTDRTYKILKELKLDQTNFRRIGIFAANEQENGREKLLKSGITEAQIDAIKLTPEEKRFYDFMQNEMETVYPRYKDVIQNVYNAPVGKVTKYFPFMTDYTEMSELEVRQRLMENPEFQTQPKKNVDLSASKTRVDRRGNVAVRIDANEVFMKHMQSVLYAVHMAREIKMLQEIAKSQKFASAAGDVAQIMTVEWLDLMARNGGIAGQDPMPFLDYVRKNTSLAMLSLNPRSIAIQSTAIIDASGFIGRYAFSGQMMQGSREWRDFAMNNSAELRNRVGDDQAYREFSDAWYDKLRSAAMTPQKIVDGTIATGVFLGAYQKFMDEKGLKADPKDPNRDGIEYANKMVRMSQASALYKDLPLFISKGVGTNWASLIGKQGKDNRSWGKALSQFQTPLFYRYANLRDYAVTKAMDGKWKEAANVVGSQVLAVITEIALRHGVKGLTALAVMSMLGKAGDDDEEKEFGDYFEEFWKTFVGNVPFISNAMSLFAYKQAPVASLAIAGRTVEDYKYWQMSKKPETKRKWAAILALDLAAIATGAPTPRLTYVIKKATEKKKKGLRYA